MNPIDILTKLVTVKDWTNFVIGLVVGIAMAFAGLLGLKNYLNLDLVSRDSYYTRQQIDQNYVAKDVVSQFYVTKADIANNYVAKTALASEYMLLSDVNANYVPRSQSPAVDPTRYILRTELAKYIPRTEVERDYLPKNTCEQQVLLRRRINESRTLNPDHEDRLELSSIGFYAEAQPSGDNGFGGRYLASLKVKRYPMTDFEVLTSPHVERFEFSGRKFTFQILSVTKAGFRISLTEDR